MPDNLKEPPTHVQIPDSALAIALLASAARAQPGDYTLAVTSSSFTLDPGTTSQPVNVTVANSVNPDVASNFMTAWQINLVVTGDLGAMGTLTFNSAPIGPSTITTLPPSYVFPTGSFGAVPPGTGNIAVTNTGGSLTANDFDANANGSQVPVSPVANLLQFTVGASAGAQGSWSVFAVASSSNTGGTNFGPPASSMMFVNVPFSAPGGQVLLGTFTVVPEPGLCLLIAAGGLGVGNAVRRRQAASR